MQTRFLRIAITLGLLSAIGPFAIDMYLPALPAIAQGLGADTAHVQLTLTSFFIALSLGQPLCGTLSDMFGRKPPLFIGLVLFGVGSVGCALANNVTTLIVFRFVQGLGACSGMVVPRAIVRDLHTGIDAAHLTGLLMLVFSVSPILAPLTGSFIIQVGGWRAVFWTVLIAAAIGIVIVAVLLAETLPPQEAAKSNLRSVASAYGRLLRDRHYMSLVLIGSFGVGSFFIYLSNSPFVLIDHYHLSPRQYSLCFSLNAISFFAVAQLNGFLAARLGLKTLVRMAAGGFAVIMTVLGTIFLLGVDRLAALLPLLFLGYGFLGLVLPTTTVLGMEEHGAIAATASALMGTIQFLVGSGLMMLVSLFQNGTAVPMVVGIAGCALASAWLTYIALREPRSTELRAAAE